MNDGIKNEEKRAALDEVALEVLQRLVDLVDCGEASGLALDTLASDAADVIAKSKGRS